MKKIKNIIPYAKKHKIISAIILIILIVVGYYTYALFHKTTTATSYVLGKVQKGDLIVSVSGSGQVSTLSKVDIKPQTTGQTQTLGQILKVNVINGQNVKAGDVIAVLDGKTALQTYNQAKASVASAQASYDKLVNGATDSDLQSNVSSVQNATASVQNSRQNLGNSLQSSYITASGLVFVTIDPFFNSPLTVPSIFVTDVYFTDQNLQNKINDERWKIGTMIQNWRQDLNNINSSTDMVALADQSISNLSAIRTFFDDITNLFTSYSSSVSASGLSSIANDKSTASNARASVNSAITSLTSALQSYQSAVLNLQQSQTSLAFKKAPANSEDIVVAKAQLDNANANLANAAQTYASRIITAPFDGQIGGLAAQIGQQVTSSDVLGTIITATKVVNVSLNEVDAAKVAAGDPVTLTFDALPNVTIPGTVSYLDPLGTVSQGVVNYSVQISMNDQNDQIKTGMTASANIVTATHTDALIVPTSAITKTNGRTFVLVPNGMSSGVASGTASSTKTKYSGAAAAVQTTVHPVMVTVGISNDTSTEILSGLNEGDSIVVRTINGTSGSSVTTARTGSIFGLGGGSGNLGRTGGGGNTNRVGTASASSAK